MKDINTRYLIIGGAPRAGTTSLFRWLSRHPAVCPSILKETRFFLDSDYPLPADQRFDGTNIDTYYRFFPASRNETRDVRVEATPDYLYSSTALLIADVLPYSRIIFVLRDPVERLVSWYNYAKQRGLLSKSATFRDYVLSQCENDVSGQTPIHMRALDQGRYWKFVPKFQEAFGDRLMLLSFDDLRLQPEQTMARICSFVGIDADAIDGSEFVPDNASYESRFPQIEGFYSRIRRQLAYGLRESPTLFRLLRAPNVLIKATLGAGKSMLQKQQVDEDLVTLIIRSTSSHPGRKAADTANYVSIVGTKSDAV